MLQNIGMIGATLYTLLTLCLLLPILPLQAAAVEQDLMYPYGLGEGDAVNERNDDGGSEEIVISTPFAFFDNNHGSLWVNTNGVISFLTSIRQFTPDPFPVAFRLVAPFWTDVNTIPRGNSSHGDVYYREITDPADVLIERGTNEIRHAFPQHYNFIATWMFIATWDDVAFFGASAIGLEKRNTFQCVLITNGRHSFAVYNYQDITWTTGTASRGDADSGTGGIPAQVGFNAGDSITFHMVNGSRTNAIINIDKWSNVDIEGRFVFRIDDTDIEDGGCNTKGIVGTHPTFGSMLGGDSVQVYGPCFTSTDAIKCKFGNYETEGSLDVVTSVATCITPTFYEVGRLVFRLSVNGGISYDDYHGIFTVVSPEDISPTIRRVDGYKWHLPSSRFLTITWDKDSIKADEIHIYLFGYSEHDTTVALKLAERITQDPISNTGTYEIRKQRVRVGIYDIGALRIIDSEMSIDENQASLWSDVHNLRWKYIVKTSEFCNDWLDSTVEQDKTFLYNLEPCPCTLQQSRVDVGRYSANPQCNEASTDTCHLKPLAVHCVRVNQPSENGAGQECCYDNSGNWLDGGDNNSGGTAHRRHHGGVAPYNAPGKVPYLSHYLADLLPRETCCVYAKFPTKCPNYYEKRPTDGCTEYEPPRPGGGVGDPHLITLDGLQYTFNGHGEFYLLKTNGGSFTMQGRMQPLSQVSMATVFTAVVMKADSADKVQVQVNDRRVLDAWISPMALENNIWERVDFEEHHSWQFTGVSVVKDEITETDTTMITAIFATSGISVQFTASNGLMMMSFMFFGPQHLKSQTQGLLGNWNDNVDDDLMSPDGKVLAPGSSLQDIHYGIGMMWNVTEEETLFRYTMAESHASFNDYSYVPIFTIPGNISQEVVDLCGENLQCIFDYQVTGNANIAMASKRAVDQYEKFVEDTQTVISCGIIDTPMDGTKNATMYTEGGVVIFQCNNDATLVGSAETQCLQTGIWSSPVPKCRATAGIPFWVWIVVGCVAAVLVLLTILMVYCIIKHCCNSPKDKVNERSPDASAQVI